MSDAADTFVQSYYIEILAVLPMLFLLGGLFLTVRTDPYIQKKHNRSMLILCALVFTLIVQDLLDHLLTAGEPRIMLRTAVSIYGYCIRPVILMMFIHIVRPEKSYKSGWVLIAVNVCVHLTALFSNICFFIDENNHFHRGLPVLSDTCLITSLILLALLLYLTLRAFHPSRQKETWILTFVTALILLGVYLDGKVGGAPQPVSFLTISIVISCVLYYIWLHLQFVREYEEALQTEQRVQLMLSQIKPHFLYNALGAIEELCESDPAAAREATIKFSDYLRGNVNAISTSGMVPFERELSHARLYLELEQLRFEDALQVEYDIACRDFNIPALTLEPIVENAVRHGIRSKADGSGTVSVLTRETPESHDILVKDDGVGFDPAVQKNDGRIHVGIQNVRDRLKSVCGGELLIDSKPGSGTTVTIRIPKTGG